jgi:hypothetical protein
MKGRKVKKGGIEERDKDKKSKGKRRRLERLKE